MKQPVDHVQRPMLPWRDDAGTTECGLDASKVPTLSREEFLERMKDMGAQRAALFTCMTCTSTAKRWGSWEDDPRKAMEREINWETWTRRTDRGDRLRDELISIGELIERHRAEFDEIMARREWNAQKDARRARMEGE